MNSSRSLRISFPPKWHLFLGLNFLFCLVVCCYFLDSTNAQQCHRTAPQPQYGHSCPFYSKEAYIIETESSSQERSLYQKECCDRIGAKWSRAAVQGCVATRCLPHSIKKPCTSLPRYIVDGQYVPYQDVKRDQCQNQWGQVSVCCPPNSQANLLMSAHGAEMNEFPHQARLESEDEVCGGTVYNYNTVITAAHCVIDKQGNLKSPHSLKLTLGINTAILSENVEKNVYRVDRITVHPGYSLHRYNPEFSSYPPLRRTYNDIALLRLGRSIDFNQNIKALRIAPDNFDPADYSNHVMTVGWGSADNGVTSHYLIKSNLMVRSNEQCFKRLFEDPPYSIMKEFSAQLHCFGGVLNGEYSPGSGRGESGSPAICKGSDGYGVLCGVLSFGANEDVCRRNMDGASCPPSVYADVSYFRNWIETNAGPQDWSTLWEKTVYGREQPWNSYPHQVKIVSKDTPNYCGGTLISRDTVVTAGHCVFTKNQGLRSGIRVLTWNGGRYRIRNGGIMVPYDFARYATVAGLKYTSLQGETWIDNVAVVKLNGDVPINSASIPSLPTAPGPPVPLKVMELAWPTDFKQISAGYLLVQRYFKILEGRECERRLDRLDSIGVRTDFRGLGNFFCGVEDYSGGGVCERNLGGGIICPGSGAGILCGVQTFRFCDLSAPAVFINLASYSNFLWRNI